MKFAQFASKRILVTGHTGFKGTWLCLWLQSLGAEVYGLALPPERDVNFFDQTNLDDTMDCAIVDVRNEQAVFDRVQAVRPEIIFHLAAQPLVRRSYRIPLETFATNVMGTLHVLEAARHVGTVQAIVNVTTDKCYRNLETGKPFDEEDPLGGHDPYSASKACVEIASHSYRDSFLTPEAIAMATARAGNVIGGGDFSEDRIVPDAIRAIEKQESLSIRSPNAVRPWQHVLDVLEGYLMLGQFLLNDRRDVSHAFNFAPASQEKVTVNEIVTLLYDTIGRGELNINAVMADLHEAKLLTLDASRAQDILGWQSRLSVEDAVKMTARWYENWLDGGDVQYFSEQQIQQFMGL